MKYYAVTDDPRELMHYGIKGMHWGIIRTDAQLGHPKKPRSTKPRSAAYNRASGKLSKLMRHGIEKAETTWKNYNSPAAKKARETKRNEKLFEKHVQLARQGRLKYKGISDREVERITDRLALERQARQLSGAEKQSFRRRLGTAIGEGIISGVGSGVGRSVSERITRKSVLKTDRMRNEQQERFDKRREDRQIKSAIKRQQELDAYNASSAKARKDARAEMNAEYYKNLYAEGDAANPANFLRSRVNPFASRSRARYNERVSDRRAQEKLLDDVESSAKKSQYEALAEQGKLYSSTHAKPTRGRKAQEYDERVKAEETAAQTLNNYNRTKNLENIMRQVEADSEKAYYQDLADQGILYKTTHKQPRTAGRDRDAYNARVREERKQAAARQARLNREIQKKEAERFGKFEDDVYSKYIGNEAKAGGLTMTDIQQLIEDERRRRGLI